MKVKNPFEPKIKIVHSKWFWKQCYLCNREFKDTDMWEYKFYIYDKGHVFNIKRNSCTNCSSTKEKAIKNLMDKDDYKIYREVENKIKELK